MSINAVAVKAIVKKERKVPVSQKPAIQSSGTVPVSQSLADMANKPVAYV